jgi:hypothetical protein
MRHMGPLQRGNLLGRKFHVHKGESVATIPLSLKATVKFRRHVAGWRRRISAFAVSSSPVQPPSLILGLAVALPADGGKVRPRASSWPRFRCLSARALGSELLAHVALYREICEAIGWLQRHIRYLLPATQIWLIRPDRLTVPAGLCASRAGQGQRRGDARQVRTDCGAAGEQAAALVTAGADQTFDIGLHQNLQHRLAENLHRRSSAAGQPAPFGHRSSAALG